jgi:hypothetical protein
MNKRRKHTAKFLFIESKSCVPCQISISSKDEGIGKGATSGDIFDREPGLTGSPSSLVVGDLSHHHNERDQTCGVDCGLDDGERDEGTRKGAGLDDIANRVVSAFRPRGVPGPTSKLSPRAPAQMGRRETEHEGGKRQQRGTRGLRVVLRPGRVRLQ